MTITNGYCALTDLEYESGDTPDNARLESIIEAVSRAIDQIKLRRFFTTAADETRYFTAGHRHRCIIDDLLTITSLKTDEDGDGTFETTWTTSDYNLLPRDGGASQRPWLEVSKKPIGSYLFPLHDDAVQVTGKFGYSTTTPLPIKEACILGVSRVRGRKNMPYGVSGSAELGTLQIVAKLKNDGEFMLLLDSISGRLTR